MSAASNVIPMTSMYQAYIDAGFALCEITSGKGPTGMGWNLRENAITDASRISSGSGVGLLHAWSAPITCALDIDNMDHAEMLLACHGINLQDLLNAPDAVQINSGNPGHAKLLYRLPAARSALPSKRFNLIGVAFELRCATVDGLSVQDVLPPSIHPTTLKPYQWAGRGDWRSIPTLPESVLALWDSVLQRDAVRTIKTGAPIDASWSEVMGALESIDPDCGREEWLHCGMAVHYAAHQQGRGDEGYQLWDQWSSRGSKYQGQRDTTYCWRSFHADKPGGITLGTLFKLARDAGWERPPIDVTDLFKATSDPSTPIPDALPPLVDPRSAEVVIPFDLGLLPPVLAKRAEEVGSSVGCDPAVPMWAGMAAVSAAVDHRTTLKLTHGFSVKPIVWLMTIGSPSDKKTPGATPMKQILKTIEKEAEPQHGRAIRIWEAREAIALAAKKRYHTAKSTPEASLDALGGIDSMTFDDLPPELSIPPRPVQLQMEVTDITSQKLARTCADQPRGVLCYLDEMSTWMQKMADPKTGESRATWVQAFEGASYKVDRVADGAIHVDNLSVAIYGNVQPKVFKQHSKQLMTDGLLQRFLYVKLDSTRTGIGNPIPEELTSAHQWEQTIRLLSALPATDYTLSEGAYKVFRQWQEYIEEVRKREKLLQSSDAYQEAIGKQVGQCARVCLIWHLIESPWQTEVSESLMARTVHFMRSTVMPTMRQVLDVSLSESSLDAWLRDHILTRADQSSVTLPELKRGAHWQLQTMSKWEADSAVMDAMSDLERVQWVARMDDGSRGATVTWAINPRLISQFQAQRDKVIAARQARRNEIYEEYQKTDPNYRPKPVYGYKEGVHGERE